MMKRCLCVSPAQGKGRDKRDRRGNVKQSEEEAQGVPSLRVVDCPVSAVNRREPGSYHGEFLQTELQRS